MKPQRGRSIAGPSLRGLWSHSATGHNGQAAKEEVSARWRGAGCRKIISGVPAGRSVFHLTSPFIGLIDLGSAKFSISGIKNKTPQTPSSMGRVEQSSPEVCSIREI